MFRHSSRIRLFYDSIHLLHQGSPGGMNDEHAFAGQSAIASQSARARCRSAARSGRQPHSSDKSQGAHDRDVPRGYPPLTC